jgi:hypothetical protein
LYREHANTKETLSAQGAPLAAVIVVGSLATKFSCTTLSKSSLLQLGLIEPRSLRQDSHSPCSSHIVLANMGQ